MSKFKDKTPPSQAAGLPLTPMIDIIFQLLIFFMIGMQFKMGESKIDTFLPTEGKPPPTNKVVAEYRISILPAGAYDATFRIGAVSYPNVRQLSVALQQIANQKDIEKSIVIDPMPGVAFRNVMDVLNECIGAQLNQVSFARPPGT